MAKKAAKIKKVAKRAPVKQATKTGKPGPDAAATKGAPVDKAKEARRARLSKAEL